MEEKLQTRNHTVSFIDPLELNLPLLDRMYKEMVDPSEKIKTLRNKINNAEGYLAVTPEYNRGPSGAIKNTLDYFLEEYYFKPSAIVSYSPGIFGGINAAQQLRLVFEQLRLVFAELGAPFIPSSFIIPTLHKVFSEDGKLIDEAYDKRVSKFLDEFEWYIEAFKNQRANGTPY
jgi:NAD(P)H-dependent FMN reductase